MPTKPVRDDFAIAGNIKLHYVQWGEQGPPVVCIHGITGNASCFQAIADELASDHRVFAYDLRGRGDSDKPILGPYWNEYVDIYFDHDVQRNSDGSIASKCYREGVLEEGRRFAEAEPEQQWSSVRVPTLLLRAGQGLFFDNDQLLSEAAAQAVRRNINNCQYVNFPTLNHYTIIFGIEPGPAREIRSFIEKG